MSSQLSLDSFLNQDLIQRYETEGLIRRTFRRLEPQRQLAVLGAILEETAVKGPTALNIKEVARRAGVSVGSLYQYFGNRQGLLNFAIKLVVENTITLFESYLPYLENLPLSQALPAYVLGAEQWSVVQRGVFLFFIRAAYQGDPQFQESVVRPVAACMMAMTRAILQAAVRRGEMRADIDVEAAARLINPLLLALGDSFYLPHLNTYYQVYDQTFTAQRLLETLTHLLAGSKP